ncbi:hypothetical protein FRB95_010772 [Tulasnella sp. JGI-2019a]|nr:hypothetical protein FRB95_010772 [Tulasnella sp. JGI-2019a]
MLAFNLVFFLLSAVLYCADAVPVKRRWEEADMVNQTSTQAPWSVLFTRHTSHVLGELTVQDTHQYATWRIPLKGASKFFGDTYQHYNKYYKATIFFKYSVLSNVLQGGIKLVHSALYRDS